MIQRSNNIRRLWKTNLPCFYWPPLVAKTELYRSHSLENLYGIELFFFTNPKKGKADAVPLISQSHSQKEWNTHNCQNSAKTTTLMGLLLPSNFTRFGLSLPPLHISSYFLLSLKILIISTIPGGHFEWSTKHTANKVLFLRKKGGIC